MDKIILNKMAFYGYHGVFPEETILGQRFILDATVYADLKQAGETDNLAYSVHYGEIYEICKEVVEGEPFKLIEALAEAVIKRLLQQFSSIEKVTLRVTKPDPPIPGHYESVAVELTRGRA